MEVVPIIIIVVVVLIILYIVSLVTYLHKSDKEIELRNKDLIAFKQYFNEHSVKTESLELLLYSSNTIKKIVTFVYVERGDAYTLEMSFSHNQQSFYRQGYLY